MPILLSVQLALVPLTSWSEKLQPERARKHLNKLSQALLDFSANQLSLVESGEDFDRFLMIRHLKPEDRAELLRALKPLKRFPEFHRRGEALVMEVHDGPKYELKWRDPAKLSFEINGVPWTYDSKRPLLAQMREVEKKIRASKNTAANFWDRTPISQVLPKAEAVFDCVIGCPVLLGMVAGGVVAVVFGDVVKSVWCNYLIDWSGLTSEQCLNLKKATEEHLLKDEPTLDAIAGQSGSQNRNVLAFYEAHDFACPADNDGRDREYRGQIRSVELKKGTKTPVTDWFPVIARFAPDGSPKDILVTTPKGDPKKVDPNAKDAAEKLIVHIAFDPKTKKPVSYRFPDPNFNPSRDLLRHSTISISPGMKLSPEQAIAVGKARDIVRVVNYRNYNCVVDEVTKDQQAGIDPGTPTAPKESKTTQ